MINKVIVMLTSFCFLACDDDILGQKCMSSGSISTYSFILKIYDGVSSKNIYQIHGILQIFGQLMEPGECEMNYLTRRLSEINIQMLPQIESKVTEMTQLFEPRIH